MLSSSKSNRAMKSEGRDSMQLMNGQIKIADSTGIEHGGVEKEFMRRDLDEVVCQERFLCVWRQRARVHRRSPATRRQYIDGNTQSAGAKLSRLCHYLIR